MSNWEQDAKFEEKLLKAFKKFLMELHAEASVLFNRFEGRFEEIEKQWAQHKEKGLLLRLWERIHGKDDVDRLRAKKLNLCRSRNMSPIEFIRVVAKAEDIARLQWLSNEERKALGVGRDFIHSSESLNGLKARLRMLRKQVILVEAAE